MQKIFVLDTNVLLHDPMAIKSFHEHKVVIPMTVLEELDSIKDRKQKDVSREARIAISSIDNMLADATPKQMQVGVPIPSTESGTLSIFPDQLVSETIIGPFINASPQQNNDNRIINVSLTLQKQNPDAFICLITKDINMRIKAKGCGLENVEDYRKDKVLDDIDLLARGYVRVPGKFWDNVDSVETQRNQGKTIHRIPRGSVEDAYISMFIIDDEGFAGFVDHLDDEYLYLHDLGDGTLERQNSWGVKPRNMEQGMAMYLLTHPEIDLNIMTGPAGSGKTLLALASALEAIIEHKQYEKLIVARSTPPIAEDIGFLPGTEEEKMAPWLAAFEDNLEILHGGDESPFSSIDYVKEKANIQFKSLNFMRGRSFNNSYVIIDEAQSLSQFQLKSIITRIGQNSKIVILGNLAQIDNHYINPLTSGLTYCVDKMKNFKHASIMHVNGIERSRLAAFAEENL
ncbi:PhoH-like protein [BD1-7 clade bacterium]|uniref:PhoH-like protein n=1 Tax=BD1-7 clade bacterium TaxID=2029982 RepID=A0A5S9QCN3_9GAMM|nr:PhoH-like protein [BD1-7 clade bacterium]